jgi:hypothetical protein
MEPFLSAIVRMVAKGNGDVGTRGAGGENRSPLISPCPHISSAFDRRHGGLEQKASPQRLPLPAIAPVCDERSRLDPKDPITLLIPLIGIALILLAVWLAGGTRRARLDRALVLRRLAEDLPGFAAAEIVIDAAAANAIAASADGRDFAIVFAAGDKVVVRPIAARDGRRITLSGDSLVIDTGDFTRGRFVLALPGEAERWLARLAT